MIPCPGKTGELSFPYIHGNRAKKRSTRLHGECCAPKMRRRNDGCHVGAVERCSYHIIYCNRLQHAHCSYGKNPLCRQATCKYKHYAYQRVHYKYLAGKETRIEITDDKKQQQSPAESTTEIIASHSLIIVLNKETKAEKQCEYCISFTSSRKKRASHIARSVKSSNAPCPAVSGNE